MATQSKKSGFPEFFADTQSAEKMRRQFIEAPGEAVAQSALGAGLELANLFSALPAAFVASQQRELERIKQAKVKDDPRVAALEQSIEHAGVLQATAQRGQVRVQRALVAVAGPDNVFHGFVSDAELTPLKGVTVRVTGVEGARSLSTTTGDDGYFSIQLGSKSDSGANWGVKTGRGSLLDRMAEVMSGLAARGSADEKSAASQGGHVEILKKGELLHSDPASLVVDKGSVYREYVIDDTKPSSASDFKKFGDAFSDALTRGVKADQSKAGADVSKPAAGPTAAPAETTKAASKAKPKKSASKKSATKK